MPHAFSNATCDQPPTCLSCGFKEGDSLGHSLQSWRTIQKPSCSQKGLREATCSRCNCTVTEDLDCIAHTPGQWEIQTYPSEPYDGVKIQKCSVCKETINKESISLTIGQRNAIKEAKSYLKIMPFSRKGLIHQLEYEGYSETEAIFAVDSINVDWNQECYKEAQGYLKLMSFSKKSLTNQLEYEGYTGAQIQYALNKLGY